MMVAHSVNFHVLTIEPEACGSIKFEISETGVPNNNKNREEALLALQTLGFNKLLIEKTLDKILNNDSDYGVEDLIRLALKVL